MYLTATGQMEARSMKCSPGAIQHLISGAEGSKSACLYHREWPNQSRGKQMYRSGVLKTTPTVPVSYPSNGIHLTGICQGFESEHNSFMSLEYIVPYSGHSCHPSCCLAVGSMGQSIQTGPGFTERQWGRTEQELLYMISFGFLIFPA